MSGRTRRAAVALAATLPVLVAALAGCDGSVKVSGDPTVTVPASDGTLPTVELGVAPTATPAQQVNVKTGDAERTLTLTSKDGAINVVVAGTDPDSGVLRVELFVDGYSETCDADTCSRTGPLGAEDPANRLELPQVAAGGTASGSASLARAFDLEKLVPRGAPAAGGRFTAQWRLSAEVTNQLGAKTRTPDVVVTWNETG